MVPPTKGRSKSSPRSHLQSAQRCLAGPGSGTFGVPAGTNPHRPPIHRWVSPYFVRTSSQIKSYFTQKVRSSLSSPYVFPTFFGEFSEFSSSPGHLSPQDFTLRLSGCCTLRRFGCAASLPRTLRRLELGLDSCERLQDATELLRGIGPLDAKHGLG